MNTRTLGEVRERLWHRARVVLRHLDPIRRSSVFSGRDEPDALKRIYVINLDRKADRWRSIRRELGRFRDRHGQKLTTITRRFSAIDARYLTASPLESVLDPTFTLAEQLEVHPNPVLTIDDETRGILIQMTRQEQAVALSHINVWRLIAEGDLPSALILEDDVVLAPGFAMGLRSTWSELVRPDGTHDFDLLYLAFRDVGATKTTATRRPMRRIKPGLWEAAAYVLTKEGAQKLLDGLPVRGPVDLWLNFKFSDLKVYSASRELIEQRVDEPSTNSYSILPILSQVGAVTREKPLLPSAKTLPGPVVVSGPAGSDLTALAEALSMLGYTCIHDLDSLPRDELDRLLRGLRTRFNAFVNIGELDDTARAAIAASNRRARFISTEPSRETSVPDAQILALPNTTTDKWAELCAFLHLDYPPYLFPERPDLGQRKLVQGAPELGNRPSRDLLWDRSPWVIQSGAEWAGLEVEVRQRDGVEATSPRLQFSDDEALDQRSWRIRDDTFPSNLALFTTENFSNDPGQPTTLSLRAESSAVRDFTGSAIAARRPLLYGTFAARIRPSNVSGLITGVFLHRNGPRQEIDIEFLGKDTTKMLVNVFYNPGPIGTKLEYGYRGTPTVIDLGFDAAEKAHLYEIDWRSDQILWKVDGVVVYGRRTWGPTPIPDQPLEFNINLWHSRSVEFAGKLEAQKLPATVGLVSIDINSHT